MKDQFVTYEIAKKLKELGFNEPCLAAFDGVALYVNNEVFPHKKEPTIRQKTFGYTNDGTYQSCAAPLWQQAIDWLRIKHNINVVYHPEQSTNTFNAWWVCRHIGGKVRLVEAFDAYDKYEQAREAAILKALELIK